MVCVQIAWVKAFDFLTKKEGMSQLYHIWRRKRCAFPHTLLIFVFFVTRSFDRSPTLIWHRRSFNDSI